MARTMIVDGKLLERQQDALMDAVNVARCNVTNGFGKAEADLLSGLEELVSHLLSARDAGVSVEIKLTK